MTDLYLRGADRAAVEGALSAAGLIDEHGFRSDADVLLTRLGTIASATGEIDEDGLPLMAEVEGWHANLRFLRDPTEGELAALDPVTIEAPATPYRIWFD